MFFNKKGQSILENVITVTLVTLGIVLSWDLSSQLTGGGIKNLVSWLEEPDPHKYLIQAPPGGGISIPGCDCDPWNPPLTSPGICDTTGAYCGDPRKGYHLRNCYPPGCENTVQPNIPTKICEFQNNCCTPWNLVGSCGANQSCTPILPGCHPDGRCNDDTGLGQRECGEGNFQQECHAFPSCQYNCNLNSKPPDPNGKDINAFWCTAPPPPRPPMNYDHQRLTANSTPVILVDGQSQCSTNPAKCKSYCRPGFSKNPNPPYECIGCPLAATRSFGKCRCLASQNGEAQHPVRCTEDPHLMNKTCIYDTGSPLIPCAVPPKPQPFITIADCPPDRVIDSGHCGFVNRHSMPGNTYTWTNFIRREPFGNSWLCETGDFNGNSGGTCHSTEFEAVAFCLPPATCPQPVLADYVMLSGSPPPLCPNGYKRAITTHDRESHCVRLDYYLPATTGCGSYIDVIGDVWVHGWAQRKCTQFDTAGNCINTPPSYFFPGTRNFFPANIGGIPPCPMPNWSGYNWDGSSLHVFCQRNVPSSRQQFCAAAGGCANSRPVIANLSSTWNGSANPPACSSIGAGWSDIGLSPYSLIRYCKRMVNICVQ